MATNKRDRVATFARDLEVSREKRLGRRLPPLDKAAGKVDAANCSVDRMCTDRGPRKGKGRIENILAMTSAANAVIDN